MKCFTEHTKRVDVWLKNDSEKRSVILLRGFHNLKEEEALIPGPGLLLETRVRDSARLHHWSMRLLMRSDIPTGSWSLNMSCGSVDIWRNFTPFMSWWITEISQTISDKTPPCPTGRQQQDGGTVASSSLVLTRRKRNYSSSPFPHLQGCIMCTPPGLAPLYWRPW